MTTTNESTKDTEKNCAHCDDCKNGTCCPDCKPGEKCACKDGACTCEVINRDEPESKLEEVLDEVKEEILEVEEKFEKSMSGPQSSWKWFFLIGILGLIIGILAGRSMGKYAAHRSITDTSAHDMRSMMQMMTSVLETKSGADLEQAFLEDMIIHHQGAVEMAQIIKSGTPDRELQSFADGIIQAQSKEIGMMEVWLRDRKGE